MVNPGLPRAAFRAQGPTPTLHASARSGVRQVERLVRSADTEAVVGDLSGYLVAIPHVGLIVSLSRRIRGRSVLKLSKRWREPRPGCP
jgi:hypothetical protein